MQNSYLFRRGVVVGLNSEAEELLRSNDVDEDTSVNYLEIPDDSLFHLLWDIGLFQAINERTGSLIDDYEEDMLEANQCPAVLEAIAEVKTKAAAQKPEAESFLNRLIELVRDAGQQHRAVLFVL